MQARARGGFVPGAAELQRGRVARCHVSKIPGVFSSKPAIAKHKLLQRRVTWGAFTPHARCAWRALL